MSASNLHAKHTRNVCETKAYIARGTSKIYKTINYRVQLMLANTQLFHCTL